jgi:hypothetical protein
VAHRRDAIDCDDPVEEVTGWWLASEAGAEIDRILHETVVDPVGPNFMAPPARATDGGQKTKRRVAAKQA